MQRVLPAGSESGLNGSSAEQHLNGVAGRAKWAATLVQMPPASVLVVEDDIELRSVLVRGLREEGFSVFGAASGSEAIERLGTGVPDLFVLDVGLPDADGRDLCQALRAQGVNSPVLFLSARDALTDRLTGFSSGGDDYVTKPFAFAELVARVWALLRRASTDLVTEAGALRLDPIAHAAFSGDRRAALTPTEFRLLARLVANPGETVRRADLIRAGWPHGARVRDNTLDTYVARLRRKLRELPNVPSIETVHGVGYCVD
jgi:two-component system response regulator MprA